MIKRELTGLFVAVAAASGSLLLLANMQVAGVLVWALAWLYVSWKMLRDALRRRWARQVGRFLSVRLLLAVGAIAPLVRSKAEDDLFPVDSGVSHGWVAWLALLVVVLLIRTEPTLRGFAGFRGTRVANLPGVEMRLPVTRPVIGLVLVQVFTLPVLLVLGVVGASGLLWAIPALAGIACAVWIVGDSYLRRRHSRAVKDEVPDALLAMAPRFVAYWDAPRNSGYELAMWIPHLKRIGLPFFIMVRSPGGFNEAVRMADGVPVVLARSLKDIERLVVPSLSAAFYVNNGAKNSHLVRYIGLTHVQLLHGESDKAASFNPVTAMFDKVFVAGQAGQDRYAKHGVSIPAEKFEIVGRPQVEGIDVADDSRHDPPSVLYAPTWRGHSEEASYSSVPVIVPLFEALIARGCRVVFRPHPLSYKDAEYRSLIAQAHELLAADERARGVKHVYGEVAEREMSVVDCFNAADVLISDVSGVVADFLYSRKPFAIMNGGRSPEEFVQEFPLSTAGYVMSPDPDTWAGPLTEILETDSMRETRLQARAHYLGPFPDDGYSEVFVRAARDVVESSSPMAVDQERVEPPSAEE